MTNAHVVEGAQRIRVALPLPMGDSAGQVPVGKRRILEARLVGQHKETDLALLKIDETDLPTLPLVSSQRPRVGQLVFAIGSPEGLQNSVTMGVVSALARQPDPSKALTYLQTDAPINPGNSGGPLVDMNGVVLGINTFILSQGGGSEGLGFAIPARVVDFVYHSLRKYGHVHRVEIGAGAQEITPTLAEGLHLSQHMGRRGGRREARRPRCCRWACRFRTSSSPPMTVASKLCPRFLRPYTCTVSTRW
jgi:serine protease Do